MESQSSADGDPEALPAGTPIGEYVLEGLLGIGGFARVYRATHPVLNTRVAIKVLSRALSLDAEARGRFVQEARAASRIEHPNVVRVLGFGVIPDGRAYQIMELVEGMSLDDAPRPDPAEVLVLLREVAAGLAAAHAAGIVHRDLKPANILLSRTGAKLADFGIAKALEDDSAQHLTRTGATLGTPVYMSPEQALGRGIGIASDLYSFGVVAFELLTGQPPFEAASPLETMMMHVQTPAPVASAIAPGLGTRFDRALAAMLQKHPEDRPATIDACIAALDGPPAPPRSMWWLAAAALAIAAAVTALAWPADDEAPAAIASPPPSLARPRIIDAAAAPPPRVEVPTVRPPPVKPSPAPVRRSSPVRPPVNPADSFEAPPDYQPGVSP